MHTGAATPTSSLHGVPRGLGWDVGIKLLRCPGSPGGLKGSFVGTDKERGGAKTFQHIDDDANTIMVRKAIVSSSSNAGMKIKNHAIDCSYAAFFG